MKRITFFIIVLAWLLDLTAGSAVLFKNGYDIFAIINIIVDAVMIPYIVDMYYQLK